MTFYEKYPQLQQMDFLSKLLTETVFSTMSLEDQQVPKKNVQDLVFLLLAEQGLKQNKFVIDKTG